MDEVICDFLGELCKRFNSINSTQINVECFTDYDLTRIIGEEGREIFLRGGFFNNLQAYPNAIKVLMDIHNQGHEIVIVTNALGNADVAADKFKWVKKNLPFLYPDNLIITSRKDLIKGDLLFEDSPYYLEQFNGIRVIMDRPYNRGVKGCRIYQNNWDEFRRLVENI